MNDNVRTRFAPSPTGYMHIGNLRTALYEYLIARAAGGTFILRIEDTDQGRLVEGATDVIFDTLKMTGMTYDEGPGKEGAYGPYIQSQRMGIYKKYAEELVEKGAAYYCFCTKERLESLKTDSESLGTGMSYDGHCRDLSKEEVEKNLAAGMPYVIRQKMPREGSTTFVDAVYGEITVENKTLEDQILLKSDGMPTYNFANVVDDHLMKITHVVRGNEYLSSTPKYNLLYKAFGWDIPTYIHLPPVMKDEHQKLSKRNGDASFQDLIAKGYLPEAVVNYIALLGWSPGGTEEFFTLKELEENFNIKGLSKSPAIFDIEKLKWMNGEYIRRMSDEDFANVARPYLEFLGDGFDLFKIAMLVKPRTNVLSEIPETVEFFKELPDYSPELFVHKKMKTTLENSLPSLVKVKKLLEDLPDDKWFSNDMYTAICEVATAEGIKNGLYLWPLRTALSGRPVSPGGATELAEILGRDETMRRIDIGIEKLS
ncbi:MAG: glutamate--tRNA ligase [Clostridia bacterium]|nr:glutamate--tRNA ligase [Clostridia bacterium]